MNTNKITTIAMALVGVVGSVVIAVGFVQNDAAMRDVGIVLHLIALANK